MYKSFRNLDELRIERRNNEWHVSAVLRDRVAYKCFCIFVERAYRVRASVIARTNANADDENIIKEYENMIRVMNVE